MMFRFWQPDPVLLIDPKIQSVVYRVLYDVRRHVEYCLVHNPKATSFQQINKLISRFMVRGSVTYYDPKIHMLHMLRLFRMYPMLDYGKEPVEIDGRLELVLFSLIEPKIISKYMGFMFIEERWEMETTSVFRIL